MEAVVVKKFGGYDALSVEPFPLVPLEGLIEVEVHYGGVNFADLYSRQGLMPKKLPFVAGLECSGIVTKVGDTNCDLRKGQRVVCYDYQGGMHSRTIRVSPEKCYPLPDHVGFDQGAATFVNYLTAYFALFEQGNLRTNQSVLILSCAGGVGWAATQLANTVKGVTVCGTASCSKFEAIAANGVRHFIQLDDNYQSAFAQLFPHGFDVIISNQSGPVFDYLQTLLKPLGRIVLLGANNLIKSEQKLSTWSLLRSWWSMKNVPLEALITHNRVVGGLHLGTLCEKAPEKVRKVLEDIFERIKEKELTPRIDSIYPMSNVVEAHRVLGERRNVGKVLIVMKEAPIAS